MNNKTNMLNTGMEKDMLMLSDIGKYVFEIAHWENVELKGIIYPRTKNITYKLFVDNRCIYETTDLTNVLIQYNIETHLK